MDHESHWIPLSDLMSGVVAVVLLLFVSAAIRVSIEAKEKERLQKLEAEKQRVIAEEKRKRKEADDQVLADVMTSVEASLEPFKASMGLVIDRSRNTLRLPADSTFPRGSADPNGRAIEALTRMAGELMPHLLKTRRLRLLVEGHADGVPVRNRLQCGADDNFTLSAYRARNARNVLLRTFGEVFKPRIGIAAYGDSRPLVDDIFAAENRRVEIRFELSPEGGSDASTPLDPLATAPQ